MFLRALTDIQRTVSRMRIHAPHLSLVRAASMLAVAGLLLSSLPQPAEAHANHAFNLSFWRLRCIEELDYDNTTDSDEPYVVMFVADISDRFSLTGIARRTDVFQDVDTGEVKTQTVRLWGTNGAAAPMPNPDNVIVIVALMENDASDANTVRETVQAMLWGSLTAYVSAGWGRAAIAAQLIEDMKGALAIGAAPGGINPDDRIGNPRELRITAQDRTTAHNGTTVVKTLTFRGGGADYRADFRFSRP